MNLDAIQVNASQGILSAALVIASIVGTIILTRLKTRADNTTANKDAVDSLWKQVNEWMASQKEENSKLHSEIAALRGQVSELSTARAEADRKLHQRDALNADLSDALIIYLAWAAAGAPPPSPTVAWHLKEHLENVRRQQAQETNG